MKLHLKDVDLEVEISPVSPLMMLRSVLEAKAKRPEPPIITYTMPDQSVEKKPNFGDPFYKKQLDEFEEKSDIAVENALIHQGVLDNQIGRVMAAERDVRSRVAANIRAISVPTEFGIDAVMDAAEYLFVEGIIAARWSDMQLSDFWALPIDMQNVLIGARRRAMNEQVSLYRGSASARGNTSSASRSIEATEAVVEDERADDLSNAANEGIPADKVKEVEATL